MLKTTIFDELPVERDLWQTLRSAEKPILLYGMGNGADKILAVFAKYGIKADDVFASDELCAGRCFTVGECLNTPKQSRFMEILSS